MNLIPTNDYTAPDDTNHPPPPFTPRPLETQDDQAPKFLNDLFSNDLFDFRYFNVGTGVVPTPRVPPHDTFPPHANPLLRRRRLINIRRRGYVRPSPSRTASFGAPPQANYLAAVAPHLTIDPLDGDTHPSSSLPAGPNPTMSDGGNPLKLADWGGACGVSTPGLTWHRGNPQPDTLAAAAAPQLTSMGVFGGTSDPITHNSASRPSGSSSAAFDSGKELSFSGIQNVPIPTMTSGLVPVMAPAALASSPSLAWMSSIPRPVVRPWDAGPASSMGPAAASTASVRAESGRAPVARCSCCKRMHPLVRVDDTIEWVRPDVMKMVLYFNWSAHAEAEAHDSWEPRGAEV